MFSRTAEEVAKITGATLVCGPGDTSIQHFCINSTKVVPHDTFVAFKGEHTDGNNYLEDAINKGATCVFATRELTSHELDLAKSKQVAVLKGTYSEDFLLKLARAYRAEHNWLVIGITGSCGKTTTKEFVVNAMKTTYKTYATQGNFNSTIGVPLTILEAPQDTQVFVCEMGMNHAGEIDAIASVARPHIGIITNIGASHIGNLGSVEAIARAKAELVPWLADPLPTWAHIPPLLCMPSDDAWTPFIRRHFAKPAKVALDAVGSEESSVQLLHEELNACGLPHVQVRINRKFHTFDLAIPGLQCVPDAMLALSAALASGIDVDKAIEALSHTGASAMRNTILTTKDGTRVIDDSYNASPASFAHALVLFSRLEADAKIAVLGEMGELGDYAHVAHKQVGELATEAEPTHIVFVGDTFARVMKEGAIEAGCDPQKIQIAKDAGEAYKKVSKLSSPNQVVLVKGSRFLGLDALVKEMMQ